MSIQQNLRKNKELSVSRGASETFSEDGERAGAGRVREGWRGTLWQLPEGRGRLDYVRLMRGDRAKPHWASCGLSDPPSGDPPVETHRGRLAKLRRGTRVHPMRRAPRLANITLFSTSSVHSVNFV